MKTTQNANGNRPAAEIEAEEERQERREMVATALQTDDSETWQHLDRIIAGTGQT